MGINLSELTQTSPCLYHVTYEDSLSRIRRLRRLECAATLMKAGGQLEWLRKRRETMLAFTVNGDRVVLTDQAPINAKNIAFQDGWELPDLIEAINRRVFFWRGPECGLLSKNKGHFKKYDKEGCQLVFLRADFAETNQLNAARGPELCKHNSGAARQYDGKPIPRGPATFVEPEYAPFQIGEVQEVVFRDFVALPDTTEICHGSWSGPWALLFQEGHEEG